jgi:hypothetical protein
VALVCGFVLVGPVGGGTAEAASAGAAGPAARVGVAGSGLLPDVHDRGEGRTPGVERPRRGGRRLLLRAAGVRGLSDPAVVALVLALASVGSLVAAPASTVVSRRIEARADVHSLDLTRDVEGFAEMQRRLAVTNLSDLQPAWWRTAFFATHPSAPWRIGLARAWARQHGLPGPAGVP